jgi:ATP-dependent DNA helicase RecG
MEKLGLHDRKSFGKNYLQPALERGLIEMTQPDSPKSPTQKYRLTDAGKHLLKSMQE